MRQIIKKIELAFWDAVIPLLSESEFVRVSMKEAHDLYTRKNNDVINLILLGAALALIIGFFLGRARILF